MRRTVVAVLASTVSLLAGCGSPKSDFKTFCRIADEVIADPGVERPDRPRVIVERFRKTWMSGKTRTCIDAVFGNPKSKYPTGLDPDNAYRGLEHCARKAGAEGWSCPSLAKHYATPGRRVVEP